MPEFVTIAQALRLHQRQIARYGGEPGVRDMGLLESALAMPMQGFGGQYLHETIPEMAGAYLFHICCNHPFMDGNKRVATGVAILFLQANGINVHFDHDELIAFVLAVASGQASKDDASAFFRRHIPG